MKDPVEKALQRFEQERSTKRGFLLTPAGAYFLYDSKFCSIDDYHIRLKGGQYYLNGSGVEEPLFVGLTTPQKRLWAATPSQQLAIERLRLAFHVACGAEPDELLRGLCFVQGEEVHFALFSDPAIEELFLAAEHDWPGTAPPVAPDQELAELQQQCGRNDLRLLTALYLKGKNFQELEKC